MSNRTRAHLAILGANIIFGINYTVSKGLIPDLVAPLPLTLIRVMSAVVFLWGFGSFLAREIPDRKDLPRLALCSLTGVSMNQMFFMTGLNYTSPIDASILMVIIPIMVLIFAAFLLKERITIFKGLGIVMGSTGALVLIIYGANPGLGKDHLVGNTLMLLNASSYALYLVLVKPLMAKYHPFTVLKWVFLMGTIVVFPFGIHGLLEVEWGTWPTWAWASLGFITFFTTFLSYLLNIFGLKYVNASTVSSYIYLQPAFATAIAMLAGKDELNWVKVLAGLIIFVGVYLVSRPVAEKKSCP